MSGRGRKDFGPKRRLSPSEMEDRFNAELDTLVSLCATYDDGQPYIAFLMAVTVYKILTENSYAIRNRKECLFPSPKKEDDRSNLSAHFRLTGIAMEHDAPNDHFFVEFQPYFEGSRISNEYAMFKFNEWWNKETIIRKSAAQKGDDQSMIPVDPKLQTPFDKRERLSRVKVVKILRDKYGAHSPDEIPIIYEELDPIASWGTIGFRNEETGDIMTVPDPRIETGAGQLAATMRQISFEVLVAYQRQNLLDQSST